MRHKQVLCKTLAPSIEKLNEVRRVLKIINLDLSTKGLIGGLKPSLNLHLIMNLREKKHVFNND